MSLSRQQRRAIERRDRKVDEPSIRDADRHFASALAHWRAGGVVDAEIGCRAALAIAPAHPSSLELLGLMLLRQRRFAEAEQLMRRLVESAPSDPAKLDMLGVVLGQLGRHSEARQILNQVIRLRPADAEYHSHLAAVLEAEGQPSAAVSCYAEACRLDPDNSVRHYNLGCALHADQRHAAAAESFRVAIRLKPDFADAYSNLGVVLREQGDCNAAIDTCRRAIEQTPEDADFHTNLGHWLLLAGCLEEGWQQYEWRLKQRSSPIRLLDLGRPVWGGEDVANRVLLLHAEQGFGDTIQFCRYVPLVASRAKQVILVVPRPLVRLLSTLEGVEHVIPSGEPLPDFDVHCPLMSLPRVCGTTLETIPANVPYLKASPERVAQWRRRLAHVSGFKVGLVWAGNPRPDQPAADRRRSIPLTRLAPLAEVPGVALISLQKGEAAAQMGALPQGMAIHDWTEELADFAETAALVEALDLVISVDTSVAHLAGALGKPVWLLNRFDTCWRWLLNREDSPWYPTLRQFRQPSFGDWDTPIGLAHLALGRLVSG